MSLSRLPLQLRLCLILVAITSSLFSVTKADLHPFPPSSADSYDNGTYGRIPVETFHTTSRSSYHLLRRTWDEERCGGSEDKIFLGIRGKRLAHTGPVIYDNDGHMVWYASKEEDKNRTKITYNFRAQWYRGEQYLTWWSGVDEGGHGSGFYYMYDKHYELYRRISPVGNYSGDLHEFLVTPQNTALMTMYDRVPADLTAYGIHAEEESYIYDCLFQEIDLETNELLFEWRASDHFIFDDCYNPPRASNLNINSSSIRPIPIPTHPTSNTSSSPLPLPITKPRAWDWFHINSVSKDHLGNYLISSRYSHSLAYISHSTGEILWQLGGKHNSFIDISPPPYTNLSTSLAWQHHASIVPLNISSIASDDKITTILVFNNDAVNWNRTIPATVLKILLNTTTSPPTSLILAAAEHPQGYIVPSQGSAQQLANGNLFVGYGYAAAMTEYSPDGKEIVCDWQYGALHAKADGAYSAGMVQSYRASKESWKGWPKGLPRVKIEEIEVGVKPKNGSKEEEAHSQPATLKHTTKATQMWISWNGATEVETWTVERRTIFENEFENEDEDLLDLGITTDMLEREHDSSSSSSAEDYRLNASGWLFVKSTKKGGFESNIVIPDLSCELETSEDEGEKNYQQSSKNRTEFRLRAMDSNNQILGLWHVSHEDVVSALPYQQDEGDIAIGRLSLAFGHSAEGYSLRYVLAWMLGLAICLLLVWLWHRRSVVKLPLTEDEGDAHLGLLYDMDDENVKNDVLLKDLF